MNNPAWIKVGTRDDLVAHSGVCALVGERQVALFYLPGQVPEVHAVDNWDPVGKANVLSRGMTGDLQGEPVVASPLYKQHFSLKTGACLEKPDVRIPVYGVRLEGDDILICCT